jgi:hypothetical protein
MPHASRDLFGGGHSKRFRGSKRRLHRIRFREHFGWGVVVFVLWVLFVLLVVIPWIGRRGHP